MAVEVAAVRRPVEIVDVDQVEAIDAKTRPARVQRAQHAFARIVAGLPQRWQVDIAVLLRRRLRVVRSSRPTLVDSR